MCYVNNISRIGKNVKFIGSSIFFPIFIQVTVKVQRTFYKSNKPLLPNKVLSITHYQL